MRRADTVLVALAAFLAGAPAALAQTAAEMPRRAHLFLERSYFAPLNPVGRRVGKMLLFEGDAAGHYFLFNGMDWDWLRSGGWRFAWPVSFMPVVRMSTTVSNPVLTPSYRVRPFWFQFIHARPETADEKAFRLASIAFGAMHYSNGQDGCTYLGFARDTTVATRPCIVQNAAVAARQDPNTRDGDFSTTFFPVAGHLRWGRMAQDSYQVATQHTLGIEVHITPLGMVPGGLDRGLASRYGRHQFTGSYELESRGRCLGSTLRRLALRGTARTPQDDGAWWTSSAIELSCTWDDRDGFGLFVRATFGGDYYNIHFRETSDPLLTAGFTWDPNRINFHNRTGRPAR